MADYEQAPGTNWPSRRTAPPSQVHEDWMSHAPDHLLAERAADDDALAFGELARRYGPLMRAYARRLTGSAADADDVVQESLLQSWNGLDSLEDPKAVKSWMMRITARRAITLLRSRKPHEPLEPDGGHLADLGAGPERHAVAGAGVEALTKALDRLPAAQRECWVLREMGGHSYEEIAETLGIGVDSVRGRIARARTSLLTEMEAWR